jgi:hypothetical protein
MIYCIVKVFTKFSVISSIVMKYEKRKIESRPSSSELKVEPRWQQLTVLSMNRGHAKLPLQQKHRMEHIAEAASVLLFLSPTFHQVSRPETIAVTITNESIKRLLRKEQGDMD